jgi:hypothetical protein
MVPASSSSELINWPHPPRRPQPVAHRTPAPGPRTLPQPRNRRRLDDVESHDVRFCVGAFATRSGSAGETAGRATQRKPFPSPVAAGFRSEQQRSVELEIDHRLRAGRRQVSQREHLARYTGPRLCSFEDGRVELTQKSRRPGPGRTFSVKNVSRRPSGIATGGKTAPTTVGSYKACAFPDGSPNGLPKRVANRMKRVGKLIVRKRVNGSEPPSELHNFGS